VLDLDPTSATAYENLGVDASASGELSAALDDLERALAIDPELAGAHNALAAVLMRQGRRQDALAQWRHAVQLNPRLYDALYNLGTVLYAERRRDEARPYLERFVAEASPTRYASEIARVRRLLQP
jgi:Tfp pilus assembly protein PilF